MKPTFHIKPDWRWGTPEGSREFDRLTDRMLTFREKLEWLEEAETLTHRTRKSGEPAGWKACPTVGCLTRYLQLRASREKMLANQESRPTHPESSQGDFSR